MDFKSLNDKEKLQRVYNCFVNDGYPTSDAPERVSIKDLVTTEDIAPFVPKVVKKIIVEAIEPELLILPNLFTRVNLTSGQMIEISALSGITAGQVAQGGDYPTSTIALDTVGATVQITVTKYGCSLNIAREVIEENQFDVIKLWLRAAGAALARLKEARAIRLVNELGITVFDNANPDASSNGVLTGRNIAGAANGTMTLNDIFDMWAHLALRGFTPDTVIMSPLAWKVFATDPQLREMVLKGATLATRRMPLGSGARGWDDIFGGLGLKTTSTGDESGSSPWTQMVTPVGSSFNIPPSYLPSPLKVLVSHLVQFNPRTGAKPITDIIMADSQRCGILVQREEVTTEEADIFLSSSHVVRVYEKYGMNVFDQGKGIVVARNVVVDSNYVFDNVNSTTLTPINPVTPLVE